MLCIKEKGEDTNPRSFQSKHIFNRNDRSEHMTHPDHAVQIMRKGKAQSALSLRSPAITPTPAQRHPVRAGPAGPLNKPAPAVTKTGAERSTSMFLPETKNRPQGGLPTASPANRAAVGKEAQRLSPFQEQKN